MTDVETTPETIVPVPPAAEIAAPAVPEVPPAPDAPAVTADATVAEETPALPVTAEPPPVEEAPTLAASEPEASLETVADEAASEPEASLETVADEPEPESTEPPAPPPSTKHWYVVKVQSGREESIKEAIERRVKIDGLEECYGQILIPVEKVTEIKNNKRVVKERKLYPGYIMAEVDFNDRILYLFRETSGVGDFVGSSLHRPPPPMSPREVDRMMGTQGNQNPVEIRAKPKFDKGDRVKIKDGTFKDMEGEVKELNEVKNQVKVEVTIFGRPVSVELEIWQVEELS